MDAIDRKLVQFRRRDANARRLFDVLRTQPIDRSEPEVKLLAKKSGLRERDVRTVFATLEGLSLGRLIVGRHGAKTRFEWSEDFNDRTRLPGVQAGEESDSVFSDPSKPITIGLAKSVLATEWTLALDSKRKARLFLPTRLTKADVAKLRNFVGALEVRISK